MLEALSPQTTEAKLEGRSFLMKNRAAALWAEHAEAHAAAAAPEAFCEPFRAAYEAKQ